MEKEGKDGIHDDEDEAGFFFLGGGIVLVSWFRLQLDTSVTVSALADLLTSRTR